jgi:chaperonin GroEL
VEEGAVPGGGVTFIQVQNALGKLKADEPDEQTGINIVRRALEEPLRQIAENAGLDGAVVVDKVRQLPVGQGFAALSMDYVDMYQKGIIDPAKVARSALQNAARIANMILVTEALVADIPEKDKKDDHPVAPDMNL